MSMNNKPLKMEDMTRILYLYPTGELFDELAYRSRNNGRANTLDNIPSMALMRFLMQERKENF